MKRTPLMSPLALAARILVVTLPLACATACGTASGKSADRALTRDPAADSARMDSLARARQDSINRTLPGYVVDSILPADEELRRFRAAVGGATVSRLAGGSPSRETLVRRFVRSLAENDTADLRTMALSAREFADLYYAESPYARPPYRQSPALAWELIEGPSHAGMTKLTRRLGGRPLEYVSHACEPRPVLDGRSIRHTGCLVEVRDTRGTITTRRLFGSIIERDGQFKFVSYTNRF